MQNLVKEGQPQTCKRCGRTQHVIWVVEDNIWNRVCKKNEWNNNKTLCLECFAEMCGYIDLGKIKSDFIFFESLWKD